VDLKGQVTCLKTTLPWVLSRVPRSSSSSEDKCVACACSGMRVVHNRLVKECQLRKARRKEMHSKPTCRSKSRSSTSHWTCDPSASPCAQEQSVLMI
jgi:hypothetical protein